MLVKHNNNSISNITTPGSLAQGKMTLISEQTASGSASISFTSGIDSTYPIYRFEFIDIDISNFNHRLEFQASTNGGTSYGVTTTNTSFKSQHYENDSTAQLVYQGGVDLAQSTDPINIADGFGNDADQSGAGYMEIFNPSSSVFVKHYISNINACHFAPSSTQYFTAGYFNTTSIINAIKFSPNAGTFSGTIKLYGIKGD